MLSFRKILLTLAIGLAIYKLFTRKKKARSVEDQLEPSAEKACPHCGAATEPSFLECWKCGKKFKTPDETKNEAPPP